MSAPDPLADYAYAGTVTVDGETSALIEQRTSREGWYVRGGDAWKNYRILAVNEREVTVEVNGETRTLTKTDAVDVVPLAANADQGSSSAESGASLNILNGLAAALGNSVITIESSNGVTSMNLSGVEITPVQEGAIAGRIASEKADLDLIQSTAGNPVILRLDSAVISPINQEVTLQIR